MRARTEEDQEPVRLTIQPDGEVPLYRQVRALLEDQLARGVFGAGRPMPSTRHLSQSLGVSRNTVALAYQELTSLGLVESRPRSGLYPVVVRHSQGPRRIRTTPSGGPSTGRHDWRPVMTRCSSCP